MRHDRGLLVVVGVEPVAVTREPIPDHLDGGGIAVTGLMMITSYLIFLVCRRNWGWSLGAALCLYVPLVVIDGAFFSSNLVKIAAGGWFPLAVGIGMFAIMTTWWRGRTELSKTPVGKILRRELRDKS